MITCTRVPVALPQDGPLTKVAIKDIVGIFVTNEWRIVDPETLVVKRNDGANRNYTIERSKTEGDADLGPLKVFLKFHGKLDIIIEVFKHLVPNKHEEAQLCHDYGQSGLGAKVYGFFQTKDGTLGRVDEFLDARNLEPEDVEDAGIRAAVARGHAAFHAMKTQLEEKPIQAYYDVITRQLEKYHKMVKLQSLFHEGGVSMDDLIDYDFASKIRRVTDRLESMGGKKGWCIHDVAFMNVMVKNNPKKGESKIVLIDFEFVFRNYRAFDIGGHFMQKVFRWVDEDGKKASCRPYTEEEKRHFCEEYVEQWNQATGDSDTAEQVFRESELGYLLAITFDIHNMLCYVEQEDIKDLLNRLDLLAFNKLFAEFVKQYTRLGLDVHE
ncbi:choline/ethanolamine kinase [Penicillium lagena]|uniref:choline/ethanolamine kinase n=1 Tax=Penicillium lagena TaxID=94218 RepID=UPI002541D65C|nr:choline/ethanolamine kinase [Penicillium lagena]KAJ5610732.1 choline/ethanolamine kinase [Penicillium lagena]